jgi:hypothetical protein
LREVGGKLSRDCQCFLVGSDAMRVRVEFESRGFLRERNRQSDILIHDGS